MARCAGSKRYRGLKGAANTRVRKQCPGTCPGVYLESCCNQFGTCLGIHSLASTAAERPSAPVTQACQVHADSCMCTYILGMHVCSTSTNNDNDRNKNIDSYDNNDVDNDECELADIIYTNSSLGIRCICSVT